jgi:hypothetical protein
MLFAARPTPAGPSLHASLSPWAGPPRRFPCSVWPPSGCPFLRSTHPCRSPPRPLWPVISGCRRRRGLPGHSDPSSASPPRSRYPDLLCLSKPPVTFELGRFALGRLGGAGLSGTKRIEWVDDLSLGASPHVGGALGSEAAPALLLSIHAYVSPFRIIPGDTWPVLPPTPGISCPPRCVPPREFRRAPEFRRAASNPRLPLALPIENQCPGGAQGTRGDPQETPRRDPGRPGRSVKPVSFPWPCQRNR